MPSDVSSSKLQEHADVSGVQSTAKLDEAKQGALVQVVDSAIPPDKRSFPKQGILIAVATTFGFFLAVFIALVKGALGSLSGRLQNSEKYARLNQSFSAGNARAS